jgi:hypothetical protein
LQVEVQRRLGVLNLLDLSRPFGLRYELDLNTVEEREVAVRLVKVARRIRDPNNQCFHDLRANGKWIVVKEDSNMMHRLLLATGAVAEIDEPPVRGSGVACEGAVERGVDYAQLPS